MVATRVEQLHKLGMQLRPVSVLFLDLKDFGRLGAELAPESLSALLSAFFEGLGPIIARHGGLIDKFMGDAVLVTYNVASDQPDHARRAVATAAEGLLWVRDEFRWEGRRFHARAGVNTGTAAVGEVGTEERKDLTVIGATVNVAAVLQGHAAADQVVLGSQTYQGVRDLYPAQLLGVIDVFGQAVEAYAVAV